MNGSGQSGINPNRIGRGHQQQYLDEDIPSIQHHLRVEKVLCTYLTLIEIYVLARSPPCSTYLDPTAAAARHPAGCPFLRGQRRGMHVVDGGTAEEVDT